MARTVLKAEGLEVFYGTSQVLFGMSLDVAEGDTMALLGRNGAGKSTTMKTIAGLLAPRRGTITVMDEPMQGRKAHIIARAGVGFVPEDRQIFPEHTVEDNLLIAAKKGRDGQDFWSIERIYDMLPLLAPLARRLGGQLSGGEQQMLTIARALMGNPSIVLLDEPSEGLAPIVVQRIGELIRTLRAKGVTILIAEQNLHFCLGLANRAAIIDKGRVVYSDTIEALRANDDIKQRYLAV
ncbi:MAG: ABC transporter ATP-binding protein [Burkholderiaceae bacterium]|nr:ABC transporter ATP-binding protein [Burkholderiaceae bacterium]MBP8309545.1 ABC transporter ATP-binding protein [Burkholderiaceae bacterium]